MWNILNLIAFLVEPATTHLIFIYVAIKLRNGNFKNSWVKLPDKVEEKLLNTYCATIVKQICISTWEWYFRSMGIPQHSLDQQCSWKMKENRPLHSALHKVKESPYTGRKNRKRGWNFNEMKLKTKNTIGCGEKQLRSVALDARWLFVAWFKAYEWFSKLAHDPSSELRVSLKPGTVVFLDNFRILHARTAFQVLFFSAKLFIHYLHMNIDFRFFSYILLSLKQFSDDSIQVFFVMSDSYSIDMFPQRI